jgi:hypothetical protein
MEESVKKLARLLLVVFAVIGALTTGAALLVAVALLINPPGYRPPAPEPERVVRIIVAGPRVGAVTTQGPGGSVWEAYETRSDGAEWFHLWRLEGEPLESLNRTPVQKSAVDPRNSLRIFRIGEGCEIEVTSNGGETWRAAWTTGRRSAECPQELAFTPDGEMLLVALGSDGIARMDSAGRWTQHAVGSASRASNGTLTP